MSTSPSSSSSSVAADDAAAAAPSDPPPLLDAPPVLCLPSSSSSPGSSHRSVALGEKLSFPDLGPIIVNVDGTTSRIANWHELSKHEQEVSLRRIAKRNAERIEILKAAQGIGEDDKAKQDEAAK